MKPYTFSKIFSKTFQAYFYICTVQFSHKMPYSVNIYVQKEEMLRNVRARLRLQYRCSIYKLLALSYTKSSVNDNYIDDRYGIWGGGRVLNAVFIQGKSLPHSPTVYLTSETTYLLDYIFALTVVHLHSEIEVQCCIRVLARCFSGTVLLRQCYINGTVP